MVELGMFSIVPVVLHFDNSRYVPLAVPLLGPFLKI